MATSHSFNGRNIKIPGAYSAVKAVASNSMASASYSKLLIVNTKKDYAFGGAVAGGKLTKGGDAVYSFRSAREARNFLKADLPWYLADLFFHPSALEGREGISQLYWVNALKVDSIAKMTLSGITISIKDETEWSNAKDGEGNAITSGDPNEKLKSGYALEIVTSKNSTEDNPRFVVKIWQGSYKGTYNEGFYKDNLPWDGMAPEYCKPELVLSSPEFGSDEMSKFADWARKDSLFNMGFQLDEADGNLSAGVAYASGASLSDGNSEDVADALEYLVKGDYSAIMTLQDYNVQGQAEIVSALKQFAQSEAKYPKYVVVPGVCDPDNGVDFAKNISNAKSLDSERVWYVHDAVRRSASFAPLGYRIFDPVITAALVAGRILGLAPQVPATFKEIDIAGIESPLKEAQLEEALDAGVLVLNYDDELQKNVILRAINTLQNNQNIQNVDGSTFSIQVSRICSQLNQDIVVNAKRELFGNNVGANLFTVSPEYLKGWVETFLQTKVATVQEDNLIIGWSDVDVQREGDAYYVSYKFQTNLEIAFAFFTGFAIN